MKDCDLREICTDLSAQQNLIAHAVHELQEQFRESSIMNVEVLSPIRRALSVDPGVFRPDPHAGFAKCRPIAGVIDVGTSTPIITRHADVSNLMTDPRTRQLETEALELKGITSGALYSFYANSMLVSNSPTHEHRRSPAVRAFAFKLIQAWRPRIRALVNDLLNTRLNDGEMEFVEAIASPLPSRIIAEILGAPERDAPHFASMVYKMSRGLGDFRESEFPEIEANTAKLIAYVERLLNDRRPHPSGDFLSDYIKRVDEAGELSEAETLIQIVSLIIAGSDTTRTGLTMLLSLLLRHRDQWDAVCADPGRAADAVTEALRYEPPVGAIGRVVTQRLAVDGVALEPGTVLSLSILSAQRDEAAFRQPQSFNMNRTDHPKWSVSFGFGPHRCLGEALARAEMEEALIAVTQRLPKLEILGDPPIAKGHSGIRGITKMRIGWSSK
jgi:cytochrome P450